MHSPTNTVQLEAAVGKKVEPGTKVMSQVSGKLLGWQLCVGLGFTQEGIQEKAVVKWKVYSGRITFHRQGEDLIDRMRAISESKKPRVWGCKCLCCCYCCSVAQSLQSFSRATGLPVHYHLPELAQTHVHRVSDAIQPTRPLSFPFSFSSFYRGG